MVFWIDFHERGTFIHPLVVLDVDLLYIPRNTSADRVKMDVRLRIVGGFEAGKILPEENTSDDQNNERGEKYPTLVGVAPRIRGDRRVSSAAAARRRNCLRWIRSRILLRCTHFPSTYSAKRDSATPVDLARDIFERL